VNPTTIRSTGALHRPTTDDHGQRRRAAASLGLLIAALLLAGCGPQSDRVADAQQPPVQPEKQAPTLPTATLPNGARITLELALTPQEISQGLMYRPLLPDDRGMLFLFEFERRPSFWMKNTIIPLDLVFLNGVGRVVDIISNAQPCPSDPCPQYIPDNPARAVLEIAAGGAARHGIEAGDLLEFERVEGYPLQPAPVDEEN
jgi:uncharacterized membrane protein (UPF0127 family)